MTQIPQDRLVRKEVALGTVREIPPPMQHIGLSLAPFKEEQSDDVVFAYAVPEVDGLAPARAEDAESELAMKDDTVGIGRASVIDWALKDHYDPSDVSRYREFLRLAQLAGGSSTLFPLTVGSITEDFPAKMDRDQARRIRKLYNRIEYLIMTSIDTGAVSYNDGKVKFTVSWGRPSNQQAQAPSHGTWNLTTADPLADFLDVDQFMYDNYGFRFSEGGCTAIGSRKAWMALLNSDRWAARSHLAGYPGGTPVDPKYLIDGWGMDPSAVMAAYARATGVTPITYDSVYRTRAIGSTTTVNHRFTDEKNITFLPGSATMSEVDDVIGFCKTLTTPHPEGNWTPGFYEWEKDTGPDPWGNDRGNGIKAFPVFPHMEFSYSMKVLP